MRINIALIADTLLTAFCIFLFIFTFTRYYLNNSLAAFILGIAAGSAAGTASYFYIRSRQRKKIMYGKEAEEKRKLALHLCLLPPAKACALIGNATEGQINGRRIENEKEIYFPLIKSEPCNTDDVLPVIRFNGNGKKKIIVCNSISDKAKNLADNYCVAVWDCTELYSRLKKNKALPQVYLYADKVKPKLLDRIKLHFSRKLCLPAFWSGATLMLMSFFTFYPIYYIISGAILLTVCVTAAIFGQSRPI